MGCIPGVWCATCIPIVEDVHTYQMQLTTVTTWPPRTLSQPQEEPASRSLHALRPPSLLVQHTQEAHKCPMEGKQKKMDIECHILTDVLQVYLAGQNIPHGQRSLSDKYHRQNGLRQ